MEELFNNTAEFIDEAPAAPIDEAPAAPIDNGYITVSRYRRSFKVPPKPRLHADAVSPGDAIKASTVRPNERLSVLSSLNIQQEESMEPLPEFSRDMRHANRRYQKAVKDAQEEAEKAKKTKKGENEE